MRLTDWVVLALIVGLAALAVYKARKKGTGCCGSCASCALKCGQRKENQNRGGTI